MSNEFKLTKIDVDWDSTVNSKGKCSLFIIDDSSSELLIDHIVGKKGLNISFAYPKPFWVYRS